MLLWLMGSLRSMRGGSRRFDTTAEPRWAVSIHSQVEEDTMSSDTPQASPGPDHQRLAVFLGRWHTTGEVAPDGSTPAAKVDAIDTYEWYPGKFFLVHHADARVGNDSLRSIEIIGYDPQRQRYSASFFDSTGGSGIEEIRADGNTWTWRGSNVMGVKEHRCIAVVSGDGKTVRARHEKSDDGKNWALWMDVTLRKQE
jgi:Protein of unknown function (DUF1579)